METIKSHNAILTGEVIFAPKTDVLPKLEEFLMTKNPKVYIASGWFNPKQAEQLERIKKLLDEMNIPYFSPKDESLATSSDSQKKLQEVFEGNVKAIRESKYVIANTQDKDMGTIFECGAAYMMGIPILYFAEGLTGPFNLMLAQSGYGVATSIEELKNLITLFFTSPSTATTYTGEIE